MPYSIVQAIQAAPAVPIPAAHAPAWLTHVVFPSIFVIVSLIVEWATETETEAWRRRVAKCGFDLAMVSMGESAGVFCGRPDQNAIFWTSSVDATGALALSVVSALVITKLKRAKKHSGEPRGAVAFLCLLLGLLSLAFPLWAAWKGGNP